MAGNANCPVVIAIRERPVANCAVTYYDHSNAITANGTTVTFDHILKSNITQEETFNTLIKPLVERVIEGFNCSVFAYGQSGAGKSYTMGFKTEHLEGNNIGIIPRCLKELLQNDADVENNGISREIRVSFLEVYMKNRVDLLSKEPMKDPRGGFTRQLLQNVQEGCDILREAVKKRHVRSTLMNAESSRSHFIFTIHISTRRAINGTITVTESKLNLVDLGGSEGVRRTQHNGIAKVEGVEIGQGLLALQKVINEMITGDRVVSHRGHVLTEVLRDSLNRNCFLTLICCIRPGKEDIKETATTLRFANSVKQIKNDPKITTILAKERLKITPRKKLNGQTTPLKRLVHSIKKPFKQVTIPHGNTFCTPQKPKNIAANKFNQTESTPHLAKARPYQVSYMSSAHQIPSRLQMPPAYQMPRSSHIPTASQRPSIAESTFSQANISTSTAFNESIMPTDRTKRLEDLMSNFKTQLMEQIFGSENTQCPPVAIFEQLEDTVNQLRNGIQPFVASMESRVDAEVEHQNDDIAVEEPNEELSAPVISEQSFRTSSPIIFKVPAPPPTMLGSIQCSVIKKPESVESTLLQRKELFPKEPTLTVSVTHANIIDELPTQISLIQMPCSVPVEVTPTARPVRRSRYLVQSSPSALSEVTSSATPAATSPARPTVTNVRRSRRLSSKMSTSTLTMTQLNMTKDSDETTFADTTVRRSRRISSKMSTSTLTLTQLNMTKQSDETTFADTTATRRRSSRLAVKSEKIEKMEKSRVKLPVIKEVVKIVKKQEVLHPALKLEYKLKNNIETKAGRKEFVSKHRSAILDLFNTGSVNQLKQVYQIGLKTAYSIVTMRTLKGKFKSLKDVEKLPIWRGKAWERFAAVNLLIDT